MIGHISDSGGLGDMTHGTYRFATYTISLWHSMLLMVVMDGGMGSQNQKT